MNHLFGSSKIFFCSFQRLENGHILSVVSTLINVMKIDVENNSIVSALDAEIDNVNLTLFNAINFNADIHNVVSTLI